MNIGITGWRGFIGSHLADSINNPIYFIGDMKDLGAVKNFCKGCDRIYHVAGHNRDAEGNILANNLLATGNLVLATKIEEVNPEIVFISSTQAAWNQNSEYGFVKQVEEEIIKRAEVWSIFRVPNVYGMRGKPFYNSVVATFAYQVAHNEKVTINNPDDTREFVYVEDLVKQLLSPKLWGTIDVKGEVMSIGRIYEYLTSRLGEHKNLAKCLEFYKTAKEVVA